VALNVAAAVRERVGNVSVMPKGAATAPTAHALAKLILERVDAERARVTLGLDTEAIESLVLDEHARLANSVSEDNPLWRVELPGRAILNRFAASAGIQVGRLKQLYLANADKAKVFADIIAIFQGFRDRT
jgi:hypothetical protein